VTEETKIPVVLQDIHLVAFLKYHDIDYEMRKIGDRISFVIDHPRTDTVISKFHSADGQVFAGKYVDILKTVRREMYIKKGE
jgi:hypothetical protein